MTLMEKEIKDVTLSIDLMKLKDYITDDLVGYVNVLYKDELYHKEPIYVKVKEIVEEDLTIWQKFRSWLFK